MIQQQYYRQLKSNLRILLFKRTLQENFYIQSVFLQCINYKRMSVQAAISSIKKNGYGVISNFLSPQVCQTAIKQINRLIMNFEPADDEISIFSTKSSSANKLRTKDYFLNSADKVSFFFQEKAFQNGQRVVPKLHSINKIGHSLHQKNAIFSQITYKQQVRKISQGYNINHPLVVQSMAILKPPKIGGEVSIHQDSTFLYEEPQTLLGFWIPLQDATLENGCLWGIPGSHKGKLYKLNKMNWQTKQSYDEILHEKDYKESDFIPIQMQKGSLAVFTGRFLHKSDANTSNRSRYAYTWHLRDKNTAWSKYNWLQRQKFPQLGFNYSK